MTKMKLSNQASRAQILKKAADYIQFMRRKNASHQQDIDDLKRQNAILEAQIRTLEKAKVTGNFAAESSSEMGLEDGAYSHHPGESETDTSDSESGRMMGSGGRKTKKMRVNGLEYK
ncbi:hypothetical protein M8J75_014763 [Diaphorina citri]|nr:hypothetical protein M8J75_014763 [Diaphorina citri]